MKELVMTEIVTILISEFFKIIHVNPHKNTFHFKGLTNQFKLSYNVVYLF